MSRKYERDVALLAARYGYQFGFGGKHISMTALIIIEKDLKKGKPTWKS